MFKFGSPRGLPGRWNQGLKLTGGGKRATNHSVFPASLSIGGYQAAMINGAHVIIYRKDAEADRAFFKDRLGFHHVDKGHCWLISPGMPRPQSRNASRQLA